MFTGEQVNEVPKKHLHRLILTSMEMLYYLTKSMYEIVFC